MRGLLLPLLVSGLTGAAWIAGCSDDPTAEPADAGPPDVVADVTPDQGVPTDGGLDCTNDEDPDGIKRHLACAGLYSDFANKTVAPENRPFKPALEFWSDGAEKQRYVYLPPGTKIDIADFDQWVYPAGTRLWKEFKVGGKRIETRLYEKGSDGTWRHTAYRWNAGETDAVRKDEGEVIAGIGLDGGAYEVPSTGQCNECHDNRPEPVLGFDALGLALPGATGITLAQLASEDRLSAPPPATSLTIPEDPLAPTTGSQAAAWLSINCGGCHNGVGSNGGGLTGFHVLIRPTELLDGGNFAELDVSKRGMCCNSLRPNPNDAGTTYARLAGGDPGNSLAAILSGSRSTGTPSSATQMPPLVTRAVDREGHQKLVDWLAARPACPSFQTCL